MNRFNISEIISKSEFVKLACIEAVHRYFHDNILDDRLDREELLQLSAYNTTMWYMYPDWRQRLYRHLQHYKDSYTGNLINDLPVCVKPQQWIDNLLLNLSVDISRIAEEPYSIPRARKIYKEPVQEPIEYVIGGSCNFHYNKELYNINYTDIGINQVKMMIPHERYIEAKEMNEDDGKKHLKQITEGYEWFTDQSPIYNAINTGILHHYGGQSPVIMTLIN